MSLYPRNKLSNKYSVFCKVFDTFTEHDILLDFGGNRGNLLYFSNGKILKKNYISIDVDIHSINKGIKEFPDSKFIHYNKYNWMYNHTGNYLEPFPNISHIDYVWAYSVFTHTDYNELMCTLKWFLSFNLKNLALSILDINNKSIVDFFMEKRFSTYNNCENLHQYKNNNIVYLCNESKVFLDTDYCQPYNVENFIAFYNIDWLEKQLKKISPSLCIKYYNENFTPFITFS